MNKTEPIEWKYEVKTMYEVLEYVDTSNGHNQILQVDSTISVEIFFQDSLKLPVNLCE